MSSKKKDNVPQPETDPAKQTPETAQAAPEKANGGAAGTEAKAETKAPEKTEADKLREELAGEKDKYLRLLAEYDNFRRRSARERDNIYADVKADTLLKLLPIYDNLERALAQNTDDEAYRKGVEMTMKQFTDALGTLGVTPIEAVGKTFDPALHNAVMHTEDETKGENEIVEEFQTGFRMGERIIRFSMVKVAN